MSEDPRIIITEQALELLKQRNISNTISHSIELLTSLDSEFNQFLQSEMPTWTGTQFAAPLSEEEREKLKVRLTMILFRDLQPKLPMNFQFPTQICETPSGNKVKLITSPSFCRDRFGVQVGDKLNTTEGEVIVAGYNVSSDLAYLWVLIPKNQGKVVVLPEVHDSTSLKRILIE